MIFTRKMQFFKIEIIFFFKRYIRLSTVYTDKFHTFQAFYHYVHGYAL